MKHPGDKGAGRRKFSSEQELADATICPLGATGAPAPRCMGLPLGSPMPDGTACAGPGCPLWMPVLTRDAEGRPLRAEIACMANGRVNAMGIVARKAVEHA